MFEVVSGTTPICVDELAHLGVWCPPEAQPSTGSDPVFSDCADSPFAPYYHVDPWHAPVLRSSCYERTIALSSIPLPDGVGRSGTEPGAGWQRAAYSAGAT